MQIGLQNLGRLDKKHYIHRVIARSGVGLWSWDDEAILGKQVEIALRLFYPMIATLSLATTGV